MKNIIFLLLFLNLYLSRIDAQINKDSLLNQLEKSTTTSEEKYKLYNQLSRSVYIYSNPDSSLYYAKQHQKLADKNGNFEQIRRSSDNIGVAFIMAGEYDSAQLYYNNLIKLIIEEGAENHLSPTYTNIGACYLNQGNFPMALDYYLKALAAAEKFNQDKAIIYNMLGVIYRNLKKYDEARNYTIKSLELAIKQNHKKSMAESSCNLGLIYDDEGNLEKALEYYQESHDYAAEIQDELIMHNVLENMALIYCQQEEYLKAEVMLLDVLAWWEEYDDKGSISNVLGNIGNIQIELGRNNEAIETCKRAYDLSVEINALSLTESACNCLYRAYKNIGNTKLALDYHEQLSSTSDSLFNEKNTEELTRLEMQFDFDKKELLTNQELKRQKILRNGFLGGFLVVFAFSGIVFAQRNRIRREKNRSDELLLNILPEEIAEELKSKGSTDAKLIDHVTVLFTDFKGFTELSEQLSAKELVETINECFSAFDHIMEKYGIEKIKTIGDAYMAAGGLPTINETHPADVVLAALEIQAFIQQEKEKRTAANKLFFEVRIGIHSGPVVAGIVGVKKFQYDIWGDTVNIASRMESSGEVGKVNISGDTYALVKDKFNCLHRGKIHAKGKGEIDMYFVEGTVS